MSGVPPLLPLEPITLGGHGVRLEPLTAGHAPALARAAADGRLWNLRYTSVPAPGEEDDYVADALEGQLAGQMLPWAVRDLSEDRIVGSTRYHDIIPGARRVEIGYTWYAQSHQRSHVNTACKLLLLGHAFEALECGVVGLRTDFENTRSRAAISALGAQQDGILRHQSRRRDGTVRDTVMFSILASEWPAVRERLLDRMARHAQG